MEDKNTFQEKDNFLKKFQDDITREALSEFNKFRLAILANQIKSKNYGHNLSKVYNM